ncbi:hypothetical protein GGR56DRAFT_661383 [Xylariaceae sp. FL0804]|nr:hypothetical protein GGR56DRAFT_661383 [Xylariaceae sp. FL0804]
MSTWCVDQSCTAFACYRTTRIDNTGITVGKMTVEAFDCVPFHVLELICESLVGNNDDADHDDDRAALYAFALANKTCWAAATPQRFRRMSLWPTGRPSLADPSAGFEPCVSFRRQYDIRRWVELLDKHGGWRHIRHLRISHGPDKQLDKRDVANEWDRRHDLDVDYFLRPLQTDSKPGDLEALDDQDFVSLLAVFLSRATGLQDLVWPSPRIPPPIVELLATRKPRCRLHMHRFQLSSLWMPRENVPQPISNQDWALATLPNLCTVVVRYLDFDDEGNVCYLEPAVMRMIAGVAPNLQHVSFRRGMVGGSLGLREAMRLGRPPWAGFHPDPISRLEARGTEWQVTRGRDNAPSEAERSRKGALRSLILRENIRSEDMLRFGELTDLENLSHLLIRGSATRISPLRALASQARAGRFRSLTSLWIQGMVRGLVSLNNFLENNTATLQHLCLDGFLGNDSFEIILRRHGKTLRSLHLHPNGDFAENPYPKPSQLLKMSAADVQSIAESCPHLIELEIPVLRCHGDAREVAVYRALSRLRQLKRAWLSLQYWVGFDEDASDDIPEEDMYQDSNPHMVTLPHLKDAIIDCAIDERLAQAIFNTISGCDMSTYTGHSNLRWLRLDINRRLGRFGTPGRGSSYFDGLMELFTREWVVERRNEPHGDPSRAASSAQENSRIRITELHAERAGRAAVQRWKYHQEWQQGDSRQKFKTAFEELWQPDTSAPEWWNNWRSFPLATANT